MLRHGTVCCRLFGQIPDSDPEPSACSARRACVAQGAQVEFLANVFGEPVPANRTRVTGLAWPLRSVACRGPHPYRDKYQDGIRKGTAALDRDRCDQSRRRCRRNASEPEVPRCCHLVGCHGVTWRPGSVQKAGLIPAGRRCARWSSAPPNGRAAWPRTTLHRTATVSIRPPDRGVDRGSRAYAGGGRERVTRRCRPRRARRSRR